MLVTETPEFFEIIEKDGLAGLVCGSCNEPFLNDIDPHAYKSKVDCYPLKKDETYHIDCLRIYVLPIVNQDD